MLTNKLKWFLLLLAFILLGGAWILLSREPANAERNINALTEAPVVGFLAPAFTAETAVGQTINLQTARTETEQPVVLNFWASWCVPCRIEMPYFENASQAYNGRIAIIGINQGESASTVTEFGNEFGITYPLLVDDQNEVNRLYNVNSLPTTLFIDSDGVINKVIVGTISQAVLEANIEALLTE